MVEKLANWKTTGLVSKGFEFTMASSGYPITKREKLTAIYITMPPSSVNGIESYYTVATYIQGFEHFTLYPQGTHHVHFQMIVRVT